jgi:uncharacterized repeat protein (TIGR01451 family)
VQSPDGTCGHAFPVTCKINQLRAGHRWTITVVAVPQSVGDVANGVHVTTPDTNSAPPKAVVSHAHTTVRSTLKLTKRALSRTVNAGHRVGFVVNVANPMKTASKSAKVCDRLPRGLVYVSTSVKAKMNRGTVCWTVAPIAAHSHRQATVIVRALPGSHGKLVNHATLSGATVVHRVAHASIKVIPKPPKPTPVTG